MPTLLEHTQSYHRGGHADEGVDGRRPGLVAATSRAGTLNVHAAVRPDGRLVVLFANTDPAQPASVLLSAPGYATDQPATRLFYGQGSSRVTGGHIALRSQMTLPPYSLTEIVLDPANTDTGA